MWRWTKWIVGIGVGIGFFFALFVPTMCRSSEAANRIKCSSNLRQIGLAIQMFAKEHAGQLPANWKALADSNPDLTPDMFICPTSPTDDRAIGETAKTWAASLDDSTQHHCSYFYAGQGLTEAELTDQTIVAFEIEMDHKDGINILFGNGSADWQTTRLANEPAYKQLLADYSAGIRPLTWR